MDLQAFARGIWGGEWGRPGIYMGPRLSAQVLASVPIRGLQVVWWACSSAKSLGGLGGLLKSALQFLRTQSISPLKESRGKVGHSALEREAGSLRGTFLGGSCPQSPSSSFPGSCLGSVAWSRFPPRAQIQGSRSRFWQVPDRAQPELVDLWSQFLLAASEVDSGNAVAREVAAWKRDPEKVSERQWLLPAI